VRAGVWLDRSPDSVVKESPTICSRVPHQVSLRRPRRWRWLRRRPRRRGTPGSPARRSRCRSLPVVALIPVPVVVSAPGRVPLITWAPVIAGRGGRGRLGPGVEAAGQSESRQSQPANHQHVRRPPNPRSRLLYSRHLPRISLRPESKQVLIPIHLKSQGAVLTDSYFFGCPDVPWNRNSTTSPSARFEPQSRLTSVRPTEHGMDPARTPHQSTASRGPLPHRRIP
jgi:hypothetical protein